YFVHGFKKDRADNELIIYAENRGEKIEICIEDNGKGLSEAEMQRLGERFWRPPGQEKSGSGLGLSIVRNVAQLHAMQLSFSQRQGGGLCVALRW
ncbi:MAG TPA: hypothetical protein DHT39_11510, partial [Pantoea sp.]|nr:hypothetical protein [Pantoea sp.]